MTKHARSVFSVDVTGLDRSRISRRTCGSAIACARRSRAERWRRTRDCRRAARSPRISVSRATRSTGRSASSSPTATSFAVAAPARYVVPQLPERDAPPLTPRACCEIAAARRAAASLGARRGAAQLSRQLSARNDCSVQALAAARRSVSAQGVESPDESRSRPRRQRLLGLRREQRLAGVARSDCRACFGDARDALLAGSGDRRDEHAAGRRARRQSAR